MHRTTSLGAPPASAATGAASSPSAPQPERPSVVVRPCASFQDCAAVAALCGQEFKEECYGQGLSVQKWVEIEAEDLQNRPSWWRQIGLACEGERLLGVVVLTLENEEDDSISWSEYSRRVGCGPTILSMLYDRVLDEPLLEHECLIDFIAVSPDARGRGVGARLMAWAEATGAAILAETEAAAVGAHGVDMTLWVAADNTVAVRLYQRAGYVVVRRTDAGACQCMASRVHNWFLGHPVWVKMRKPLPPPKHLAACKPEQLSIPLTATVGAAAAEAQLAEVPLERSADAAGQLDKATIGCGGWARNPQPQPVAASASTISEAPASPGRSLLHKLSHSLFATPSKAAPSQTSPASGGSSSQGPTPRIAAVGGGGFGAAVEQQAQLEDGARRSSAGAYLRASTFKEGAYTQLSVHAVPSSEAACLSEPNEPCPGSVASASVASAMSAPGDSDSDAEGYRSAYRGTASVGGSAGPDVFELVELSTNSLTAPAPPAAARA